LIDKSHRWQKTAVAAAAFALLGLAQSSAFALSLGRINVLSALGMPLRAEIDIPEINAEEAASLRAEVAAPAAFAAAGLEYNASMSGLQATLQKRADGRAYIRLAGEKSVNEPFVDMILEVSWSSGRIVRDYTMLFDPPLTKSTQTIAPTLAQSSGGTTPSAIQVAPAPAPARIAPTQPKPASAQAQAPAPAPVKAAPKLDATSGQQITVKNGDTASKIAAQVLSNGVSLDQMLVAMMRTNPDAFSKGNLNRLKSGSVLTVPSAEQAQSVAPREASQMVIAQSKDFNDFRRNLASNAPKADVVPADRKASGNIDAKVEDKKPVTAAPDKLTLSKGSVQSKADEAKLEKERAEKDAAARAAEIAKNIADLGKLSAASAPKAATPAVATPALPAASETKAPVAPVVAVAPTAPASAAPAVAASAPQVAASTPVVPKTPVVAAPVPEEAPGLLDELLGDPLVPAAAGGLVALLGGFAFWRIRERNKNAARVDSSFLESRLQPDSFFGASGGQRVDTANDARGNPSSIAYTSSQLDAADDVDPVAEADVYLAYGRDLQAEEILKEAVRHNPGRVAIHVKLLEIFAKRRDVASFKAAAQQAFKLTGVDNADWATICELGLSIDPDNPLYQPGVASVSGFGSQTEATDSKEAGIGSGFGSTMAQSAAAELSSTPAGLDLDLDLDFSADEAPASAPAALTSTPAVTNVETTTKLEVEVEQPAPSNSIEFSMSASGELSDALPSGNVPLSMDGISLTDNESTKPQPIFDPSGTMPLSRTPEEDTVRSDHSLMNFDMDGLSLDLDTPEAETPSEAPSAFAEDPLETKLALADEFVSIGDEDGARALIEEVLSEATGEMRTKAQQALANLS
jgi:pilus assembly protein FimV